MFDTSFSRDPDTIVHPIHNRKESLILELQISKIEVALRDLVGVLSRKYNNRQLEYSIRRGEPSIAFWKRHVTSLLPKP